MAAIGNGTRWRLIGWILTPWPTPFPLFSINSSGREKTLFWQMGYTNLLKWLIELHRIRPGYCVTLQDLYRCTINPKLFKKTIEDVEAALVNESGKTIILSEAEIRTQAHVLGPEIEQWTDLENGTWSAPYHDAVFEITKKYGATILDGRKTPELDHRNKRLEAVKRWYEQDWMKLDEKLRTSCVEGLSSFLSLFDMPDVAETFCPEGRTRQFRSPYHSGRRGGRPARRVPSTQESGSPAAGLTHRAGKGGGLQHARWN